MPTDGPPLPDPKARSLARGPRKYRRKVASPKQWQAIQAAKLGPCRLCGAVGSNGRVYGKIQMHHLVARDHFGDDVADNIVPLCPDCHHRVTIRAQYECRGLMFSLSDAEYAYMIERGGEGYPERAYGIEYRR
jgi:hypothetical protein